MKRYPRHDEQGGTQGEGWPVENYILAFIGIMVACGGLGVGAMVAVTLASILLGGCP